MGLRKWLQARRKPDPRRPWVRPEFLALVVFLTATTGLFAFWAAEEAGAGDNEREPATAERTEYVGLSVPELLDLPSCADPCTPDGRLAAWKDEHPSATVLEETPMYYRGILIGYEVRYREPLAP